MKNIHETRNYFIKEIEWTELKVCANLNCSKHFLIFASAVTGSISISTFAFLAGIPIRITSSALGLKNCAIIAAIKNE